MSNVMSTFCKVNPRLTGKRQVDTSEGKQRYLLTEILFIRQVSMDNKILTFIWMLFTLCEGDSILL